MIRRIWAIVSETDFYAFRDRARREGFKMGPALAALVHLYAKGTKLDLLKYKNHYEHITEGVDYIKERRLEEVDKNLVGKENKK